MTEAEWLSSASPRPLLEHSWGKTSDRKFRLFQVACCRRIWELLPDDDCREAVLVAERYADGAANDRHRQAARNRIAAGRTREALPEINARSAAFQANEKTVGRTTVLLGVAAALGHAARRERGTPSQDPYGVAYTVGRKAEADLIRDLFGNPFRPVAVDPSWLSSTVVTLAEGIYADRAFDRLPILADALQDAGCDNVDVLHHCRGDGVHVRGCWVVDLLLGKA